MKKHIMSVALCLALAGIGRAQSTYDIYDTLPNGKVLCFDTLNGQACMAKLLSATGEQAHEMTGSVTIPSTISGGGATYPVTSIGDGALFLCFYLDSVSLPATVTRIGDAAFNSCFTLTSLALPAGLTYIGRNAFMSCEGLTSINIPEGIDTLRDHAFESCKGLLSVTIPNHVRYVGEATFRDCTSLQSITMGNELNYIGSTAFQQDSNLTDITFGPSLVKIEGGAFESCTSLEHVEIPEGVTSVGGQAFSHCSNLSSITLPSTIDTIGTGITEGCTHLSQVYLHATSLPVDEGGSNRIIFYPSIFSSGYDTYHEPHIVIPCGTLSRFVSEAGFQDYEVSYATQYLREQVDIHVNLVCETPEQGRPYYDILSPTCDDPTVVVWAVPEAGYRFVCWSNGSTANPDTLHFSGDTTLSARFTPNIIPQICRVGVEDGRNCIQWVKTDEVQQYHIYRETAVDDEYELVASVPYAATPVWVDTTSHPNARSYRYRMTTTNLEGYEGEPGEEHKTMHLTINRGIGNRYNLIWNEYDGAGYSTYIIYRGSTEGDLQQIDQMPANDNTTYTDEEAPAGDLYYQVGIVMDEPCTQEETTKTPNICLSNIASTRNAGIAHTTPGTVTVRVVNGKITVSGCDHCSVHIYDVMGRYMGDTTTPLPAGGYLVQVAPYGTYKVLIIK